MALMFDLNDLVNMMSIGTLMAYILVAASVLLLRYKEGRDDDEIVDGKMVFNSRFFNKIFEQIKQITS